MVSFKLKIKHQGSSRIDQYTGKDGKIISKKIAGAIEDDVYAIGGRRLLESAETNRERTLYLAAVFFQRVVSRTPIDEDYYYTDKNGDLQIHHKDNDVVRYSWTASYNNRKITAKDFIGMGLTFDRFNDEGEIRKIYEAFRQAFIQGKGKKNIRAVHIDNTHERFPMLEYGEYEHDGSLKRGEKYYHGVSNGYSVQAPRGMLRITQAEFESMSLNMSTNRLIKEYVRRSQRINKIPSESKMKEVKRVMKKRRVTDEDIEIIEKAYK